jgi:DNA ligase 1
MLSYYERRTNRGVRRAEAIIAKMGMVVAQYKYDGLRAQIHKDGQQVTIFSRNLEDQSHMFHELIAGTLRQVRADRAISLVHFY